MKFPQMSRFWNRYTRRFLFLSFTLVWATSFQNCGAGFTPTDALRAANGSNSLIDNGPVKTIALGQADLNSASVLPVSASTINASEVKFTYDGVRFFVGDYKNNRVLIWNRMPTTFQQPADVVLGQTDMVSYSCNRGDTAPTASTLCNPGGVYSNGSRLYVADYSNNRVLIWNSIPTQNGVPADLVLGQNDFVSGDVQATLSATAVGGPWHLVETAGKLIVTSYADNRVLIWNVAPHQSSQPADVVVGQPDMVSRLSGAPVTAVKIQSPYEAFSDGVKLFVADAGNRRILIWNHIPDTNGVAADIVIGQPDMITAQTYTSTSAQTLGLAASVYAFGGRLYVLDSENNRLLIWNQIPTVNDAAADLVFGQPDFSTVVDPVVAAPDRLNWPEGLFVDSRRVIIGDAANNRILIFPFF